MGKMANWKEFNRWEDEYHRKTLPRLTVRASFQRFCELMKFSDQLIRAGQNYKYLRDPKTNPHLRDLIEYKRQLNKAKGKC